MMCVRYVHVTITRLMRGVMWHAGGAAQCDAHEGGWLRTRGEQDMR